MGSFVEALSAVEPMYEIPGDDLIGEVLIPAMTEAAEVRIASGYFDSNSLAQIAPGLASLLKRSEIPLKLMISPEIDVRDREAIAQGVKNPQEVIDRFATQLLVSGDVSESALATHTRQCLAFLIATKQIEIRFVLMRQGMYHKKQWLIRGDREWVAVHGSGNATVRGLLANGEQMSVDRDWDDGLASQRRIAKLVDQWDVQWRNRDPHALTLSASNGLLVAALGETPKSAPTIGDFWLAWQRDFDAGLEPEPSQAPYAHATRQLTIPRELIWKTGQYSHQGDAVRAFLSANSRGVLAIATGGGKTVTSLIAAAELQRSKQGPMLVVVLVPTRPLMMQWAQEVRRFGLEPLLPSILKRAERQRQYSAIAAGHHSNQPRTEVVIFTNSLYVQDEGFRSLLSRLPTHVCVMVIGDEMHNLGAPKVREKLPERASIRLGLSATPIRQYDPDGTDALFEYFGEQIYEFGLAEAIRAGCLTPYRYRLHEVALSAGEFDLWLELTERIAKAGYKRDDDGRVVGLTGFGERLLRRRRAVLEQAESKIQMLRELLLAIGPTTVSRCLIYASGKAPALGNDRQIETITSMLSEIGIISHQLTGAETSRSRQSERILEEFGRGEYQVLTAMKVLDEGIDIPQTDTAFILASSAVEREWVQRRGRILRKAPNKSLATLHDFLVVPPLQDSPGGKSILKSELRRAEEFAKLSENEWDTEGPRYVIGKLESRLNMRG